MGLFARIFSNPKRQLEIAADGLSRGQTGRALAAADDAIAMLQPRIHTGGAEIRALLSDAWFLKGKLALRAGKRDEAFRAFFACIDRVPDDGTALEFTVDHALALREIPIGVYPALVGYVAHAGFRQHDAGYDGKVDRIRKLLRPRPENPDALKALEPFNVTLRDKLADCAWCRYHLGIIAAARGKWNDAGALLNQAIALDPRAEAPRRLIAFVWLQLGRPRDALKTLVDIAGQNPRRSTLLLMAHVEMVAGSMAKAAEAYQRADKLRSLGREDTIAYAETLVRCSRASEAGHLFARLPGNRTAREHVVQALASADKEPIPAVRNMLAPALKDTDTRSQAAGALLAIAIANAGREGTVSLVGEIPEPLCDDRSQIVLGLCLAADRRWGDAQAQWSRVRARRPVVAEAEAVARLNGLIDRYNAGDFAGIVVQAGAPPTPAGDAGRQYDRVLRLALWHLYAQAPLGKLDRGLLAKLPPSMERRSDDAPDLAKVLGATFAAAGDDERALELLRGSSEADAALIGARSALRLDRPLIAMKLLRAVDAADPRRRQLMALAFACSKDWDAAVDALGPDRHGDLAAAVHFLAGQTDELLAATSSGGATSYFKAVCLLRGGKTDAGRHELQRVEAASALRGPADHLAGWLDLRDAATALAAGDAGKATEKLISAARNWPGPDGAMAALPGGEDALLSLLVPANHREALRSAFGEGAERAGFADPRSCHRLAILHLVDGFAAHRRGDDEAAIAAWESTIGCIAVVVAGRAYMNGWRAGRTAAYDVGLPDFDIEKAVVAFCGKLLDDAARAMRERAVAKETLSRPARPEGPDRAAKLSLMLEAEIYAAELLAKRDGYDLAGRSVVCGPAALASSENAADFGEYCLDLALGEGRVEQLDPLDPSAPDGVPPGSATELEYFFSSLRLPALLVRKGNLDDARNHLYEPACFPLCQPNRCRKGPLEGCPGQGTRFIACNPAFARDNGTSDLSLAARGLQLIVLLKIAERGLKQKDPAVTELKSLWDEAVKVAKACGQIERAVSHIRGLVLGRVQTLNRDDRLDLSHELLQAAYEVLRDEELGNELALQTTNRAIEIANKTDDFDKTVQLLREAYRMTPHQPRVRISLVIALQRLAPRKFKDSTEAARALLQEAWELALRCLQDDPYNTEVADTLASTEQDYILCLRGCAVEALDKDEQQSARFLRTALEVGLQSARRAQTRGKNQDLVNEVAKGLAIRLSNMGVDIANAKRGGDALKYLTAAWMLDPGTLTIVRNFAGVLRIEGLDAFQTNPGRCFDYLTKATVVGNAWLRTGNDQDLRRIVNQSENDLGQIRRALGGAHRLAGAVTPLPTPSPDWALDFINQNRLLPEDLALAAERLRQSLNRR